ncbi:hypothetical protein BIV57_17515 [Mangrovactinospora gilvigrisea]|uniref:Metalloprotease n=1 Tax=Mangrovactinospora gilvigrisea TaxID=1428644 RepID=A0A1J7C989_9ACTN|nr:protealysin inhibitor emfourin [Mangrovactinospora gilvigrisea]OIV36202.1 hypothetical protein BIV57_17515 [Mangrovactinospora gilvigrisea]
MRIAVTRSGGFAGLTRRAVLETAGRPDGARLEGLARRAVASAPAEGGGPGHGVPDGFHYEISAAGRTARCAEKSLNEAQQAVVDAVLRDGDPLP